MERQLSLDAFYTLYTHEHPTISCWRLAVPALMRVTLFVAEQHRDQRRKGEAKAPYINHPIMVVNLLAHVGLMLEDRYDEVAWTF